MELYLQQNLKVLFQDYLNAGIPERKELQGMLKKAKDVRNSTEIQYWDKRQLVKKINQTVCTVLFQSRSCRFFDKRIRQSTTLTGLTIVKHMSAEVNKVITGKYDPVGDAMIYGDTDSVTLVVIVLKEQIDKGEIPWDKDNVIKLYDPVCEGPNETFESMLEASIVQTRSVLFLQAREIVAESGLYITKKRYAALVYDVEGFRSDIDGKPGKVKAMGLDRVDPDIVFHARVFERTALMVLTDASEKSPGLIS